VPEGIAAEALQPLAAFNGRRQEAVAGGVRLVLRHGSLRCVAAEAPVARLTLSGPPEPVLALAATLARDLPLLPARAALPEAARALALQIPPRPRRLGPPDLGETETVADALALAIAHLTEVLLWQTGRIGVDAGPEGVHQSRVAIRRLRSCLKQFRPVADAPALRELDAMLGELARAMGAARDLDVFLRDLGAALGRAAGEDRRVATLLRVAEARRRAAYAALAVRLDSPSFRALVWAACRLAVLRDWAPEEIGPAAPAARLRPFAAATLARRWRQLRRRGAEIEALDAEALHELRLAGKRLRYAAELFAPLWPGKASRRFLKRLAALQEALGLANDTHVARVLAAGLGQPMAGSGRAGGWAVGLAEGFALARGAGARRDAIVAWGRLRKAEPFWKD
jgi:CHAD domain-containing protein